MMKALSALLLVVSFMHVVQGQQCTLPDDNEIDEFTEAMINAAGGDPGTDLLTATVSRSNFLCLASGTIRDTYRWVTVAVEYVVDGEGGSNEYRRISVPCEGNVWDIGDDNAIDNEDTNPDLEFLFNSTARTDCRICLLPTTDNTGCRECTACTEGLGLCTDNNENGQCCVFYFNNMCVDVCPTNYTANPSNDCVCDISCDPGYSPNGDCDSCVLSDICVANNPCDSNCNCTLINPPNNYTCICPTSSSSASATPTPTPTPTVRCSVRNCEMCDDSDPNCCRSCMPDYVEDPVDSCGCIESMRPDTTSSESTSTPTPTEGITDRSTSDAGTIAGVIVAVVLGVLLLLTLATLIVYVIYYFIASNKAATKKANSFAPFSNGKSHDNPLYLGPEELSNDALIEN